MIRTADISPCGRWRYVLTREWEEGAGTAVFVMLNPSVGDGTKDDPTIRRCIGFARDWGYKRLLIVNLYAFRTPYPKELRKQPYDVQVGPHAAHFLGEAMSVAAVVVCAWGAHLEQDHRRYIEFLALARAAGADERLRCLGRTKAGHPKHPLRLAKTTPLTPFPYEP